MKPRIVIKCVPDNDYYRKFHTTFEVSNAAAANNFYRPLDEGSVRYLGAIGKIGQGIIEALIRVDGVTDVTLKPYEVGVVIGEAFFWEQIQPDVISALKKAFEQKCGAKGEEVQVVNG